MKIQNLPLYDEQIDLAAFEQKHGYEMVVTQRSPDWAAKPGYGKYYAQFKSTTDGYGYGLSVSKEDSLPGLTEGFVSDGNTPDEAIKAHLKALSGKRLAPDLADRTKDFWVGEITYTPA
jgi:hypothetical protein